MRAAWRAIRHTAGPLFYQPTLLVEVPDEALIMREETFGPVGAVTPISFGGVKQSGIGREGSRHGLEAFTDLKYPCLELGFLKD
ncbi:aldehyde dehydrogenase family protein [Mesorhizobium sp. M0768]|uniref:aldehyde dehydrogenase family protein n=1 Tax=Mesorhizobium sp. M0768 TaxID=2956996 RepID=UPI003335E177